MKGLIYLIRNNKNGKIYVGQTRVGLKKRFAEHKQKNHPGISQAMNKWGADNFSIEMIEEVEQELLDERETFWIKEMKSYEEGYNLTPGGGSQFIMMSPEARQKISESGKGKRTGKDNPACRPEVREKIRQAALRRVNDGWVSPTTGGHTEEAKQKMRGKKRAPGFQKGRKLSEETKEKIRQAHLKRRNK